MAARKDLTDRKGKSKEMIKRGIRLTDEENNKLNRLMGDMGLNLRDLIAYLVEKEFKERNL
jgi:hypothetical protein